MWKNAWRMMVRLKNTDDKRCNRLHKLSLAFKRVPTHIGALEIPPRRIVCPKKKRTTPTLEGSTQWQ